MNMKEIKIRELKEEDRLAIERRADKLRVLYDIVKDRFDGAHFSFEQHAGSDRNSVSSFIVMRVDSSVIPSARTFIEAALPAIGISIICERRDAFEIMLRDEAASADEKAEMLRILKDAGCA
ncbi:hypothetical protein [Ruegeria sp. ANG-R]|uniref:hypothetical protein n=1 Tax=Ruegeria sp. ANG-R TaxID=1577903 RepID=UPI000A568AF8|nr:hypothetical protein [Ruegeria sp. ANG-R]